MKTNKDIATFLVNSAKELIDTRRWFHQHPELAFKEQLTSKFIVDYLKKIGLENVSIHAGTGVVCEIGTGTKTAACRFNMDGLPIPEKIESDFQSLHSGYSHSCGHDFELAWGLLIAKYFAENKPANKLKLLFQPAEEEPGDDPYGRTGGQVYAELGLLDVDGIFSLHVDPEVNFGTVSIIEGEVTCAAYDFEFVIEGKSCHAAKPHLGINPIYDAAKLIVELYELEDKIKSSFSNEEGFIVITPSIVKTKIDLETAAPEESQNTIPGYAFVKGISRVRSKQATKQLLEGLEAIAEKFDRTKLNLVKRAPATLNDTILVDLVMDTCKGNDLDLISRRTTWRDDAGWGSEKAPTAHGFNGIGGGSESRLHSPYFFADERALEIGLTVFIGTLDKFLNS